MRIKTVILTILAIMAMLVPTARVLAVEPFWTGTATTTVVDPLEVYSDAGCTHLVATGGSFPVSPNPKVGDVKTLQLWVKNTSTSADYTVTPQCAYDATAFSITGLTPIAVNRSTVGSFTFTITALKTGTYSLTLNLSHN